MKTHDITARERRVVRSLGGPWQCNNRELAAKLGIGLTRAAHVILLLRGEEKRGRG